MKCPVCEAWAEVRETRKRPDNTKHRRYECANGHTFSTKEAVVRVINDGTGSTRKPAEPVTPQRVWPFGTTHQEAS